MSTVRSRNQASVRNREKPGFIQTASRGNTGLLAEKLSDPLHDAVLLIGASPGTSATQEPPRARSLAGKSPRGNRDDPGTPASAAGSDSRSRSRSLRSEMADEGVALSSADADHVLIEHVPARAHRGTLQEPADVILIDQPRQQAAAACRALGPAIERGSLTFNMEGLQRIQPGVPTHVLVEVLAPCRRAGSGDVRPSRDRW